MHDDDIRNESASAVVWTISIAMFAAAVVMVLFAMIVR